MLSVILASNQVINQSVIRGQQLALLKILRDVDDKFKAAECVAKIGGQQVWTGTKKCPGLDFETQTGSQPCIIIFIRGLLA